jgi:hypothetical protein
MNAIRSEHQGKLDTFDEHEKAFPQKVLADIKLLRDMQPNLVFWEQAAWKWSSGRLLGRKIFVPKGDVTKMMQILLCCLETMSYQA